jgi:hypothetical protein
LNDLVAVFRAVAAIDTTSHEVYYDIRIFQLFDPRAKIRSILSDRSPRSAGWTTSENDNGIAFGMKMLGKQCSYLAAASRQELRGAGDAMSCALPFFSG